MVNLLIGLVVAATAIYGLCFYPAYCMDGNFSVSRIGEVANTTTCHSIWAEFRGE